MNFEKLSGLAVFLDATQKELKATLPGAGAVSLSQDATQKELKDNILREFTTTNCMDATQKELKARYIYTSPESYSYFDATQKELKGARKSHGGRGAHR